MAHTGKGPSHERTTEYHYRTESPKLPGEPTHYSALDLQALVSARLDAIADEMLELGYGYIPSDVLDTVSKL